MLRLNVGTNRKIGQPDFGSAGASCNLEIELDTGLFQDCDGLQQVVRRAYAACNQAVNDELVRLQGSNRHVPPSIIPDEQVTPHPSQPDVVEGRTTPATQPATASRIPAAQVTGRLSPRPATASQVRAIRAICSRRRIDLVSLLRERFGLHVADELGIRQASDLIDELKSDGEPGPASGAGTNVHANVHTKGHTNGSSSYQPNGDSR